MNTENKLMDEELNTVNGGSADTIISYTAVEGDTLASVAEKFGVTKESITRLNWWSANHHIESGETFIIDVRR